MEHLYFIITHQVSEDVLDSQYSRKGKRRKLKGTAVGLEDKLKPARLGPSSMDSVLQPKPGNKPGSMQALQFQKIT